MMEKATDNVQNKQTSIPIGIRLAYACGHVMNDLWAALWFAYFLVYFSDVTQLHHTAPGLLLLIGQGVDAVTMIAVGFASDKTREFSYGRHKTWHLIGSACVAIFLPFLFNKSFIHIDCPNNDVVCWPRFAYYAFFRVIVSIGFSVVQLSHLALIPKLASNEQERVELNSVRNMFTMMSFVLLYGVAYVLLGKGAHAKEELGPSDQWEFSGLSGFVVGVGLVTTLIFHIIVKERRVNEHKDITQQENLYKAQKCKSAKNIIQCLKKDKLDEEDGLVKFDILSYGAALEMQEIEITVEKLDPNVNIDKDIDKDVDVDKKLIHVDKEEAKIGEIIQEEMVEKHIEVTMTWKSWLKEHQLYQICILYMLTRVVVVVSQVYVPIYVNSSLNMEKTFLAIVPLIMYCSSFIASMFMEPLNKYIGLKRTYIVGSGVAISSCIWMWFIKESTALQILGASSLSGAGSAIIFVTSLSIIAELIGNQATTEGFVYGLISFVERFATGIAVAVVQHYHPCEGASCCSACEWFYKYIVVLVPGGSVILSLLVLATLIPFTIGKLRRYPQIANETD